MSLKGRSKIEFDSSKKLILDMMGRLQRIYLDYLQESGITIIPIPLTFITLLNAMVMIRDFPEMQRVCPAMLNEAP